MRSLPLLFLLSSTAGAFSPATLPRVAQHQTVGLRCNVVSQCNNKNGVSVPPSSSTTLQLLRSKNNHFDHVVKQCTPTSSSSSSSLYMSTTAATKDPRVFTAKKRIAILMSFMTGWADYIFIKKYNFFATMMTGNSMKMANAIVDARYRDTAFFLSVILSYIVGVGTFRRAELSYKEKALNGLCAPIVAGCFLWADYLGWSNPGCKFVPAMLLSFAWGIINSVGSEVTGTLIFVVTGAMTRFSNMIVDRISRTAGRKKIPKEGCLMSLSVIGGFILGAAWSAFLYKTMPQLTNRGAFSIMGAIYGLFFLWLDREMLGAWWTRKNGKLCEMDAEEVDCK